MLEGRVSIIVLEIVFLALHCESMFPALQASSRIQAATSESAESFASSPAKKQFSFDNASFPFAAQLSSMRMDTALPTSFAHTKTPSHISTAISQLASPHPASPMSLSSVNIDGLLRNPGSPISDVGSIANSPFPGAAAWWNRLLTATPPSNSTYASPTPGCSSSRSDWSSSRGSLVSRASSPASSTGAESKYAEDWSDYAEDWSTDCESVAAPTPTPTQAQVENPCMQGTSALNLASALCRTPCHIPIIQVPMRKPLLSLCWTAVHSAGVGVASSLCVFL